VRYPLFDTLFRPVEETRFLSLGGYDFPETRPKFSSSSPFQLMFEQALLFVAGLLFTELSLRVKSHLLAREWIHYPWVVESVEQVFSLVPFAEAASMLMIPTAWRRFRRRVFSVRGFPLFFFFF